MDKIICVDFQDAAGCFEDNLAPLYKDPSLDDLLDWFDRWIDWVVGGRCTDGTDIEYCYPYSKRSIVRLDALEIKYEVRCVDD